MPLIPSTGVSGLALTGAGGAGEAIVLDPYTESTSNAPLWIQSTNLASGIAVSADGGHQYPTPEADSIWVSSPETEGELRGSTRPQRRTISVALQAVEPTDAAATNACTNPVFATGTAGWTNNSLTTMAASAYQVTDPLVPFLSGFDTALHTVGDASADSASFSFAVQNGVAQTVSAWVWVNSGSTRLEVWTAAPAVFATGTTTGTTSAWQRVSLTFTPNVSATWTLRLSQAAAGAHNAWWTGVQIGPPDPYFDGDMAGCDWTGTRNASTSTRPAPGGARYARIRADVEDKLARLNARGGTYRRSLPTGEHILFDVQEARLLSWTETVEAEQYRYVKAQLEFICEPYGRGVAITV